MGFGQLRAEVRRSWFSFRDSLSGAKSGGKLWLTASISLEDGSIRISTSEGENLLRPRRLAMVGPNKVLISGLDSERRVQRSFLRFATPEEAAEAVSMIKELGVLESEMYTQGEEVPCEVRVIVPKEIVLVLVLLFLPGLGALLFSLLVPYAPVPGIVFLALIAILFLSQRVWLHRIAKRMFESTNALFVRRVKGSLSLEGQKVFLKPFYYSTAPTNIEWKTGSIFLLKFGRIETELRFQTSDDALRGAKLVKTGSPQVRETWASSP